VKRKANEGERKKSCALSHGRGKGGGDKTNLWLKRLTESVMKTVATKTPNHPILTKKKKRKKIVTEP